MFRNYSIVAFRSLIRNRLFSTINIFGLGISMAVALLTIAFATEINGYDSFHENKDRIYRITNAQVSQEGEIYRYASTSLLIGERARTEISGIEQTVSIYKGFGGDLRYDNNAYYTNGLFVSEEFLDVFTFPVLHGNPETALDEPFSVVLTEEMAIRVFGRTDVLGEVLRKSEQQYTVTGILKDLPKNSHIKFEAIASMSSMKSMERYKEGYFDSWHNMWSGYAYILLPENHNLDALDAQLKTIQEEENAKNTGEQEELRLELEGLMDIFPGDGKYNQLGTVMPKEKVNRMIILTIIVMFCACFNYANLTIARSLKRAKEIGVRKVVGANKSQIFFQFVSEAIFVSLLALTVAFLIFNLIKPQFLALDFYTSRTTTLDLTTLNYLNFTIFAIAIGVLAGLIPALLMTKFKLVSILKGVSHMKASKGFGLRNILVGIQFALSMGFAVLVTLAYQQYKHALNFDLGYTTENILNVPLHGNDADLVFNTLTQVAEVQAASKSAIVPSTGGLQSSRGRLIGGQDSTSIYMNTIDEHYIENLEHELLAGENFRKDDRQDQMIVNEQLIKAFHFETFEEALGRKVKFYSEERVIIGVVKDFHYGTIYNELKPFAFVKNQGRFQYVNLKVRSNNLLETMKKLEEAWMTIDQDHEFDAQFYHEQIERTYSDISSTMKTYGFLSIVAICVSILGLLGMAVYTAESRIKELTIRKVLGATVTNILVLLSKNFAVIFVIAAAAAIPLSLYIYRTTMLENIEFTQDVQFWEPGSGALAVIVVAMLTIGFQAIKAAKSNPAENLRNE
ncbi:hypothetical protein BFP97_19245 [Roseivirga sp. 4D4]|nr:hypothetical protein BFP97_19245 [Roseivirga sp. 4D4]